MLRKQLKKALTIIIAAAFVIECVPVSVLADQTGNPEELSIVIETNTGTQTDARTKEEENKANNPSEYDKVNNGTSSEDGKSDGSEGSSGGSSSEDGSDGEDAAEEIIWEEVHIKTADDLLDFAKNCSLDSYSKNKKVYLDADISMTSVEFKGIPYFNGQFDGQGHTVRNLLITDSRSYLGFFNKLDERAIVCNLNISGYVTPTGTQTIVGGIAGSNKGIISGCSFEGTVSGEDYIGGITGVNELSGIVIDCTTKGIISGVHFTGGIAGENMGNIINSANEAGVNISNKDSSVSVEDISVDSILAEVGVGDADKDEAESSAMVNGVVDTGGIAGLSIGVIQNCENRGTIGYVNVGYNVGGIAGRQSGYILSCTNSGHVLGRKDVGGIVGQAEPYVTIDFANDITTQLSENIEKLHDILEVTLDDADDGSDTMAARLAVIKTFTDQALNDVRYLENESIDWANQVVATANEAISRADYIMDEAAKKDGVMDKTNAAATDAKTAMGQFNDAIGHLDIYAYLTPEEKTQYDAAKSLLESAVTEHAGYVDEVYAKMLRFYMDDYKYGSDYTKTGDGEVNENDLSFKDSEGNYIIGDKTHDGRTSKQGSDYTDAVYSKEGTWVHRGAAEDGSDVTFPGGSDAQVSLDGSLSTKASSKATTEAESYADAKYAANHPGQTYSTDVTSATETISTLTLKYSDKMSKDGKEDAQKAVDSLKKSMEDAESAGRQAKDIVTTINGKSDLALPSFSGDYKLHANSLTNNIQGMSDNFGLLSQEMNGASDNVINDLKSVNDQFNVIMLLFTDAIDGVLDNDYSDTYTDNSLEVCRTTTDATVELCRNTGTVEGSINVSGICGTMAIEYDFDLESDMTGVKDAAMNKSYQTKCVLRDDINYGTVTAQKNYAGGVCGLQELGTITGGQNYSKITSSTASYVGGIAGSSVSAIVGSYAKCSLSGKSYVGGICGDGARIYDSLAMATITDADEWYGAVAGHVDDNSDIKNNYFISDDLAGIDRVSYSGEAEPVSYTEARSLFEYIPAYFDYLYITFVLDEDADSDDDEVQVLKKISCEFGQSINEEEYPEVPAKDGYYVKWDIPSIDSVSNDEVVTATYVRNNTTLAGDIVRLSRQSAILVDGAFKEGDQINTTLCISQEDALPDMLEYWDIVIPDDGQTSHTVRYIKPENMEEWPDIYICKTNAGSGEWEKIEAESISTMGSYETFSVDGNEVKLQMVRSKKQKLSDRLRMIIKIAAVILGLAVLIIILILIKRSKNRVHKKVKKQAQAIIERSEAREPAIKFMDESDLQDKEETEILVEPGAEDKGDPESAESEDEQDTEDAGAEK